MRYLQEFEKEITIDGSYHIEPVTLLVSGTYTKQNDYIQIEMHGEYKIEDIVSIRLVNIDDIDWLFKEDLDNIHADIKEAIYKTLEDE